MRIGFVVNDIATQEATYTTTRLAMAAVNRGHASWLIGSGDLAFDPDDSVRARARSVSKENYKSTKTFLDELRGQKDGRNGSQLRTSPKTTSQTLRPRFRQRSLPQPILQETKCSADLFELRRLEPSRATIDVQE